MNCKKCGSQIFANEEYCRNCGEKIDINNQIINQNYNQINNQVNNSNINNMSGNSKLILNRKKNIIGCAVKFDVYIDNQLVGKIKNGQILEFEVTNGVHQIAINKKNPVNVTINADTTADVVVFGANNFGITNINGQTINSDMNVTNTNAEKTTNTVLITSIVLPIISVVMCYLIEYYIAFWVYAIIAGYAVVNISGLKNLKGSDKYNNLLIKNIIAIILLSISMAVTIYLFL